MVDGVIRLKEPEKITGKRVPIDRFFQTLAEIYGSARFRLFFPSREGTELLVAENHMKREIAEKLDISTETVEARKTSAKRKLDIESRRDIIVYAVR